MRARSNLSGEVVRRSVSLQEHKCLTWGEKQYPADIDRHDLGKQMQPLHSVTCDQIYVVA